MIFEILCVFACFCNQIKSTHLTKTITIITTELFDFESLSLLFRSVIFDSLWLFPTDFAMVLFDFSFILLFSRFSFEFFLTQSYSLHRSSCWFYLSFSFFLTVCCNSCAILHQPFISKKPQTRKKCKMNKWYRARPFTICFTALTTKQQPKYENNKRIKWSDFIFTRVYLIIVCLWSFHSFLIWRSKNCRKQERTHI